MNDIAMKSMFQKLTVLLLLTGITAHGQQPAADELKPYQQVATYLNPVLPGDHPDPTLLRIGKDFYH